MAISNFVNRDLTVLSQISWNPTKFKRFVKPIETSTGPSQIVTDAGEAIIKALGNKEGPHALAREYISIRLANWFGLPTFEHAILKVLPEDEIPLGKGRTALPGPAFVTKYQRGGGWSGSEKDLKSVENLEIITKLIVFDTWILNVDRHPPENIGRRPNYANVFLSEENASHGKYRMIAMDHSHCFVAKKDLTPAINNIEHVKDNRIYGVFPAFIDYIKRGNFDNAIAKLKSFSLIDAYNVIEDIPKEWQVTSKTSESIKEFLFDRAKFLVESLPSVFILYNRKPGKLGI